MKSINLTPRRHRTYWSTTQLGSATENQPPRRWRWEKEPRNDVTQLARRRGATSRTSIVPGLMVKPRSALSTGAMWQAARRWYRRSPDAFGLFSRLSKQSSFQPNAGDIDPFYIFRMDSWIRARKLEFPHRFLIQIGYTQVRVSRHTTSVDLRRQLSKDEYYSNIAISFSHSWFIILTAHLQ